MAQLSYNFDTVRGFAGGIYDLAPYAIDTFLVEGDDMQFGIAVVPGTKSGITVKAGNTGAIGVTVNNLTTELDIDGNHVIHKGAAIGVMRYGRIWVRVAENATGIAYNVAAKVDATGAFGTVGTAINGRFLTEAKDGIALVELYNVAPNA